MKTLCIDAGNTSVKIAVAEQGVVHSFVSFELICTDEMLRYLDTLPATESCIVSSVGTIEPELLNALSARAPFYMELRADTPIPIRNLYATPETLGKDRLAAVVGAYSLYPGNNILVIDAGTALTVDFLDENGNYHGGNISPGLQMRFQALHDYTKRLPLEAPDVGYPLLGDSTTSAIVAGVQYGIIFEIEAYIENFSRQYSGLKTLITGGDAFFLADILKKPILAMPNLVIIGLEEISRFNALMR